MSTSDKKSKRTVTLTEKIVITAVMTAILCVIAPLSLPVGAVPVTLATFAVYLVSCSYKCGEAVSAVMLYVVLGAFGLPVFSSFGGGLQKIIGLTGGYIIGYIPCAAVIGFMTDRFERKKFVYPLSMAVGTIACYALGTAWFMLQTDNSLTQALMTCVVPFLAGDAVKIAAASLLGYKLRFTLKNIKSGG